MKTMQFDDGSFKLAGARLRRHPKESDVGKARRGVIAAPGNRRAKSLWAALLIVFSTALAANAEWNLTAYSGANRVHRSDVTMTGIAPGEDLRFESVPFRTEPFRAPPYYGYRAGYYFTRHFGLEGEFIHSKIRAEVNQRVRVRGAALQQPVSGEIRMADYVQRFDMTHGLNFVLGNVVARAPLRGNRSWLVARAGGGIALPHVEVTYRGLHAPEEYQVAGAALHAAAGFQVQLWRGLLALAEYKFTHTSPEVRVFTGSGRTRVWMHHVVIGVGWKKRARPDP